MQALHLCCPIVLRVCDQCPLPTISNSLLDMVFTNVECQAEYLVGLQDPYEVKEKRAIATY